MDDKLYKISDTNLNIIKNIIGTILVKGSSLVFSILLLPAYLRYFENQIILGIWYTILSILSWVNLFDLGLGNGLRNKLPAALITNDIKCAKEYISTTYILMAGVSFFVALAGWISIPYLNWNLIFNVDMLLVKNEVLIESVQIVFLGIIVHLVLKIITSILYAIQKSAVVNALLLLSNFIVLVLITIIPSKDLSTNLITMSIVNVCAVNIPYIICTFVLFAFVLKNVIPSFTSFQPKYIKGILGIGISLLWLQMVFMVLSSTNEIIISNFTKPEYVVEYQAYFKVFKTAAMAVSLALTPIWSAVTRAQVKGNYLWIKKTYHVFLVLTIICFIGELCVIPILQRLMDVWLGNNIIETHASYAVVFAFSSAIMVLHNVNTSIGNGLSYFKLQIVCMTVAAVVFIPLSYMLVKITGSWIGVVIANSISLLPYELLAPIFTMKLINDRIENTGTASYALNNS